MTRSLKKGPYVATYLLKQVEAMNAEGKKGHYKDMVAFNNDFTQHDWTYFRCI